MAEFDFPKIQPTTLGDLWRAVVDLLPQLRRDVRRSITVHAYETAVAHGLPFVPQAAIPMRTANVSAWESKSPDSKNVYLTAASETVVNVEIIP